MHYIAMASLSDETNKKAYPKIYKLLSYLLFHDDIILILSWPRTVVPK